MYLLLSLAAHIVHFEFHTHSSLVCSHPSPPPLRDSLGREPATPGGSGWVWKTRWPKSLSIPNSHHTRTIAAKSLVASSFPLLYCP
jgi:hypothetical protein